MLKDKTVISTVSTTGKKQERPAIQRFTDTLVDKALLWAFPRSIRPNHLTIARFIFIPVVLVLLGLHLRWWALGIFVIAISSDFIDGAIARTRDQITALGTVMDPVADKLLVAAVLAWVGYKYLVVQIILGFIVVELLLMAIGVSITLRANEVRSSNVFGKTKMVIQSIALLLFLLSGILGLDSWKTFSVYMLWVALAFAVISGGTHVWAMIRRRPSQA
jgi:CDP-diacylglycerol---glycerol-3-phosphate 3-phosphatidyltransferase